MNSLGAKTRAGARQGTSLRGDAISTHRIGGDCAKARFIRHHSIPAHLLHGAGNLTGSLADLLGCRSFFLRLGAGRARSAAVCGRSAPGRSVSAAPVPLRAARKGGRRPTVLWRRPPLVTSHGPRNEGRRRVPQDATDQFCEGRPPLGLAFIAPARDPAVSLSLFRFSLHHAFEPSVMDQEACARFPITRCPK